MYHWDCNKIRDGLQTDDIGPIKSEIEELKTYTDDLVALENGQDPDDPDESSTGCTKTATVSFPNPSFLQNLRKVLTPNFCR